MSTLIRVAAYALVTPVVALAVALGLMPGVSTIPAEATVSGSGADLSSGDCASAPGTYVVNTRASKHDGVSALAPVRLRVKKKRVARSSRDGNFRYCFDAARTSRQRVRIDYFFLITTNSVARSFAGSVAPENFAPRVWRGRPNGNQRIRLRIYAYDMWGNYLGSASTGWRSGEG